MFSLEHKQIISNHLNSINTVMGLFKTYSCYDAPGMWLKFYQILLWITNIVILHGYEQKGNIEKQ